MCQKLHIPYKQDPDVGQQKMNWLAIERWANHIVDCCCKPDTPCVPWDATFYGFSINPVLDSFTLTIPEDSNLTSIAVEGLSTLEPTSTISLLDSFDNVLTTFAITEGTYSYTFPQDVDITSGTIVRLRIDSDAQSSGEPNWTITLTFCSASSHSVSDTVWPQGIEE